MQKCRTPGCRTQLAPSAVAKRGPYCRSRCNCQGPLPAPTRKSTQDLLDDYDNRIKALQAGRANVQRTMDEFPVEVRPEILAELNKRSDILADIEQVVRLCLRPNDPRQCGQALLEYLQARPNLFVGIRF